MPAPLLDEARKFLAGALRGKHSANETIHPWRKGWEFAYLHSMRVERITCKLHEAEGSPLSAEEFELLRLAAILHDVGRLEDRQNHAQRGARITAAWLEANPALASQVRQPAALLDLIAKHSVKDQPAPDALHAFLRDADLLDEIGILSVFMAGNRVNHTSPFFFHDLRDRLVQNEIPFCERVYHQLNTPAGREYLRQKQAYIEMTIAQLDIELDGGGRYIEG